MTRMLARSGGRSGASESSARPPLSIVIPAFNEERRLGATLDAVLAHVDARAEVIVVDDGSRDGTAALVRERSALDPRVRLVALERNSGKGAAVRAGFLAARGDLVLFSDADNSTPIGELEKLRAAIDGGADVAIGSRALPGSDVRVKQHVLRQRMGETFNLLVRALGGLDVADSQCGFKLFRRETALPVFERQTLDGFAFDVEILYLAGRRGLRVAEVPVTWINSPDSRVNILRDPLLMLRDVLRVRWNDLRGRYR